MPRRTRAATAGRFALTGNARVVAPVSDVLVSDVLVSDVLVSDVLVSDVVTEQVPFTQLELVANTEDEVLVSPALIRSSCTSLN